MEAPLLHTLPSKIQAATAACVSCMADASDQAVQGSALSNEAGGTLTSIEQAVSLTVRQVQEIHSRIQAASEEMSAAAGQVAASIRTVEEVANHGLAAIGNVRTDLARLTAVVSDTAQAARDLRSLAGALEATVQVGA